MRRDRGMYIIRISLYRYPRANNIHSIWRTNKRTFDEYDDDLVQFVLEFPPKWVFVLEIRRSK